MSDFEPRHPLPTISKRMYRSPKTVGKNESKEHPLSYFLNGIVRHQEKLSGSAGRVAYQIVCSVLSICCVVSCTTSPKVERRADGSYVVDAGSTFMASRAGVVAEVKTREGDHIKYLAKGEDSTKVPTNFLRTAATALAGYFWSEAAQAAEVTTQVAAKEATKLGTVQSNNATALGLEGLKQETAQKSLEAAP